MSKVKTTLVGIAAVAALLPGAPPQLPPGGEGPASRPAPFGGPPGGGFFPARGDALEGVKAQIGASDEEWKVIGPKLRAVMAARSAVEAALDPGAIGPGRSPAGGFAGPGGRGPGGPGGGDSFRNPADRGRGGFGPPGGFGPGRRGPGGFGEPDRPPGGPDRGDWGPPPRGAWDGPGFDRAPPGGPAGAGPGPATRETRGEGPTTRPATTRPARIGPDAGGLDRRPFGERRGPGGFGEPDRPPGGPDRGDWGPPPPGAWGGPGMDRRPPGGPGGGPRFGGPPGFGGRNGPLIQALSDVQAALADPNTTTEQLRDKTAVLRAARQKARAELDAAQKDLLELLTFDQQAVLVGLGLLD